MNKEIFNKSNLKIATAFLSGIILVLFIYAYVAKVSSSEPVVQEIKVSWPLEEVSLFENQVFIVDLPNIHSSANKLRVFWDVENGALTDEMIFDGTTQFKSEVDVSNWDWKKDGKYKLSFIAKDETDTMVAQSTVVVFVGDTSVEDVVLEEEKPLVEAPEIKPEIKNTAVVHQPVIEKPVPVSPAEPLAIENNFKVEWVSSDIKNNQKFIYDTAGYNDNDISAFWSTEGGHQNLVFKTNPGTPFTAAINVFGWRWQDKGPYKINFTIADKKTSAVLASESLNVLWKGEPGDSDIEVKSIGVISPTPSDKNPIVKTPVPAPAVPVKSVVTSPIRSLVQNQLIVDKSTNFFTKNKLFVPAKPAVEQALSSTKNQTARTALKYVLSQPNSVWLNGDGYDSDEYIQSILIQAETKNQVPAFVLYNIPNRDCGSHSSGGTASVDRYKVWIDRIAKNLTDAEAIVIVEPDALAQLNCLQGNDQADRIEMIKYAVEKIVPVSPNIMVYIDAGHPRWVDTTEIAKRLQKAGIEQARGFSLNVSNYVPINDNIVYGNIISNLLGGKKYVIDSSRNGNGISPTREWCNPAGRALGEAPSLSSSLRGNLDAVLWIKFPGESDGYCNGGPSAGAWWTEYAVDLYKNK